MDDVTRFAALRDESQRLLDDARSLVGEMRSALDHCRRHRPARQDPPPAAEAVPGMPTAPTVPTVSTAKTHRGGRVGKRRARRAPRRPR